MTGSKVKYVNFGIGNVLSDGTIIINEVLKKDKRLHDYVLKHELSHSDATFSKHDLMHDLKIKNIDWELFKFALNNPSCLIQYSPIMRYQGKTYLDINTSLFLLVAFFVFLFFFVIAGI